MNLISILLIIPHVLTQATNTTTISPLVNRLLQNYDRYSRPLAGIEPTNVKVQYRINRISNVSPVTGGFETDMILRLQWNDTRLQYNQSLSNNEFLSMNISRIWTPDIYFINQLTKMDVLGFTLKVNERGTVFWSRHIIVSFSMPFKLQRFPFDTQSLSIRLTTFSTPNNRIQLQYNEDWEGGSNYPRFLDTFQSGLWKMNTVTTTKTVLNITNTPIGKDLLTIQFVLSRMSDVYIMKYVIPLFLIGFCSTIGYWVDASALPTRGGFAVSLLLSTVTLNFVMTSDLPKVAYATSLDILIVIIFGFVFISLLEYAIVHYITITKPNQVLTDYVDATLRFMPIPLILTVIYTFSDDTLWTSDLILYTNIAIIAGWIAYRIHNYQKLYGRDEKSGTNTPVNGEEEVGLCILTNVDGKDVDLETHDTNQTLNDRLSFEKGPTIVQVRK
ncbi:Gamma-aminobutyric acid receptor subunit gamma-1 [Globomyces sp. JEL0801]|nr:Gamma-aminobutyric acid receptor subunit gamma-1 [Globomyces sp. JEL0801]